MQEPSNEIFGLHLTPDEAFLICCGYSAVLALSGGKVDMAMEVSNHVVGFAHDLGVERIDAVRKRLTAKIVLVEEWSHKFHCDDPDCDFYKAQAPEPL